MDREKLTVRVVVAGRGKEAKGRPGARCHPFCPFLPYPFFHFCRRFLREQAPETCFLLENLCEVQWISASPHPLFLLLELGCFPPGWLSSRWIGRNRLLLHLVVEEEREGLDEFMNRRGDHVFGRSARAASSERVRERGEGVVRGREGERRREGTSAGRRG